MSWTAQETELLPLSAAKPKALSADRRFAVPPCFLQCRQSSLFRTWPSEPAGSGFGAKFNSEMHLNSRTPVNCWIHHITFHLKDHRYL